MKNIIQALLFALIFTQCGQQQKTSIDISKIHIDTEFIDFHHQFFNTDSSELPLLKNKYPYLFPTNISDSITLSKIKNSDEKKLYSMADSVFGDFQPELNKLTNLYKHIKYYNPKFRAPKTVTLITGLDYNYKTIYADSLVFISLDMYLGNDSEVYSSFPSYISHNYTKNHMIVDVAKSIVGVKYNSNIGRSFLESMIYFGKQYYILEKILPQYSKQEIIGFQPLKYNWAVQNEAQIWSYFISEKLLYSTDKKLSNRFINAAPFSKFYLETDDESPGRIGTWIGWKIVQSYMNNNTTSLEEMILLDAEVIFKNSKYKPKK